MEQQYKPPKSNLIDEKMEWRRSKWLSGWIWFMLFITGINIPATFLMSESIIASVPRMSLTIVYMLLVLSVISIVGLVLILRSRKIGVWLFIFVVIAAFFINFFTMGIITALWGLIGALILMLLIFKGGEHSAWAHLS